MELLSTLRDSLKVLPLWQICCQISRCFCQILILTGGNWQHNYEAFGSLTIWGYVTVRTLGTIVVKYPGDQMFDHFDKFAVRLVDVFVKVIEHLIAWKFDHYSDQCSYCHISLHCQAAECFVIVCTIASCQNWNKLQWTSKSHWYFARVNGS